MLFSWLLLGTITINGAVFVLLIEILLLLPSVSARSHRLAPKHLLRALIGGTFWLSMIFFIEVQSPII